ncbi:MAG: fasciclin domain-containing protein [Deltaproteobacteria bacterium]
MSVLRMSVLSLAMVVALGVSFAVSGEKTVMVGGQAMFPKKDIIDNAVNSADHTTLVAAVKAAGLVETLKGKGPFTVFAPVNDAFENLPAGTVETLLKPENKGTLTAVLTYHVVPGSLDYNAIKKAIVDNGGKATIKTAQGENLTAMMNGGVSIVLKDAKGNVANISTYDVYQSNGVIHVIDKVLLPK